MKNVKAVVLAGGIGKRFWPLSHKATVPFLGKPLLTYNLEMLKQIGIGDVVIVAPQGELEHFRMEGMNLSLVTQPSALGMGDAVFRVKEAVGTSPCLIMNAADIADEALYQSIKNAIQEDSMFVVGKKVSDYFDGGYLKLDGNRLMEVIEKPGKGNTPSNLINLVFHYFPHPSVFFEALEQTKSDGDDVYERALSRVLGATDARVIVYDGYWQPVKYPWHVLDIMDYFLNKKCTAHRGNNIEIRSNVVIEGLVDIEDNVRIFENTKIVGPCYIGHGAIIGNNNIIRHSHIGSGCVTGFNTDITRSYVGDGCWFHSNYIGDSVLEGNVNMGSGSVLANLRLDEGNIWSVIRGERVNTKRNKLGAVIGAGVGIGVNTSIMPGIKIGKHSWIGAGVVIDKDIPDESFVMGKTSLEIQQNTQRISTLRSEFKKKI